MSRDPRAVHALAVEALKNGEWQRAAEISGSLLEYAPSHGGVHFVAGVAALQLNQLEPAVSLLQRACKLSPNRADYAAQLARALASAGLIGDAVRVATTGLALPTDDPLTLHTLGMVLSEGNAHVAAADAFARAVALTPDQPG